MPELNVANRQVCDVDIRFLKTMAPFLFFDTANSTTAGVEGSSVYARAKGANRIAFADPIQGTMSIEAQVYPFKLFALLSDGVIETEAAYAKTEKITCTTAGQLDIKPVANGEIKDGTLFVYPDGEYGNEEAMIAGTFADNKFTASGDANIEAGETYHVGYIVSRSGVKKVSFNNKKLPRDYYITMNTLDKSEDDLLTPFVITCYKASIQRTFELAFSSEGDPASVTLTFDLMEDKDGNVVDMIELTDEAY